MDWREDGPLGDMKHSERKHLEIVMERNPILGSDGCSRGRLGHCLVCRT